MRLTMQLKSVVTFHAGKTIKIPQPQQSLTVSEKFIFEGALRRFIVHIRIPIRTTQLILSTFS